MTEVSASVKRNLGALPEVMRLAEAFFASAPAGASVRFPVELALEEIFTNIVRHNREGTGAIRIDLRTAGQDVVISITDFDAPRFDPVSDAPPVDIDKPLDERQSGGLGIHLVRKMMDRIEYSHSNRTGTITLHKRMD